MKNLENDNWAGGHLINPQALMAIRDLELRAKVVVEGFWSGLHRSPTHGFSVEFSEYRQYSPGDDPRYLDWKLFARSDRYYIKKFEDETNLRCHLLVDQSRSMAFSSLKHSKFDYSGTLAATLAYFLFQQGDAIGLLTFSDEINSFLPARNRPGHLRHLMLSLERSPSGNATDLEMPLQRIIELVHKRGLLIIISDFLAPLDSLKQGLIALRACGHEVQVFQVLDPAERHFSFDESNLFEDIETGKELYIDPSQARETYLNGLESHLDQVASICKESGMGYRFLTTDQPLELQLFHFLKARTQKGLSSD